MPFAVHSKKYYFPKAVDYIVEAYTLLTVWGVYSAQKLIHSAAASILSLGE